MPSSDDLRKNIQVLSTFQPDSAGELVKFIQEAVNKGDTKADFSKFTNLMTCWKDALLSLRIPSNDSGWTAKLIEDLVKHIAKQPEGKKALQDARLKISDYYGEASLPLLFYIRFSENLTEARPTLEFLADNLEQGFDRNLQSLDILEQVTVRDSNKLGKFIKTLVDKIENPQAKLYFQVKFGLANVENLDANSIQITNPLSSKYNILYAAIENGDEKIVRQLIKLGADLNTRNVYDETPVYQATRLNQLGALMALLEAKPDLEAQIRAPHNYYGGKTNEFKETALHMAVTYYDTSSQIANALLDAGANPLTKDELGRTALMACMKPGRNSNHVDDVELVQRLAAPITQLHEIVDNEGKSLVERAMECPRSIEILDLVFSKQNDLNGLSHEIRKSVSDAALKSAFEQFEREDEYGDTVRSVTKYIVDNGLLESYDPQNFIRAIFGIKPNAPATISQEIYPKLQRFTDYINDLINTQPQSA